MLGQQNFLNYLLIPFWLKGFNLSMQFQLFVKLPAQLLTKLPMLLVPTQEYDESS